MAVPRRRALMVIACALALAGCTTPTAPPSGPPPVPGPALSSGPPAGVALSFIQQRYEEGTPRGNVRIVNPTDQDLTVTGVGVDWPGYGPVFVTDYDTVVSAGQTLDLRLTMPEPVCTESDRPPVGVVRLTTGTVAAPLDASGTGFLTRMWQRRCEDLAVSDAVRLRYHGPWTITGTAFGARLDGSIELIRRHGTGDIAIDAIQGSVLLTLSLPRPVVLRAGEQRATFPLVMSAQRCDGHGLSQSSQTFFFRPSFRIADADPVAVIRLPDPATEQQANRMLRLACRGADHGL